MSQKMDKALNRIVSFTQQTKKKNRNEVDLFVKEMKKQLQLVTSSVTKLENSIEPIETAISKSSPELGLDQQMEPLISAYINNVEDRYNRINECIAEIKNFEKKLFEAGNIEVLLSLTDSSIAQVEKAFNNKNMKRSEKKILSNAQKLQQEAYEAFKSNKKTKAATLTSESYYSIINLSPAQKSSPKVDEQYESLVKNFLDTEKILHHAKSKKPSILYNLAEEHLKKAIAFIKEQKELEAQKEIDLCSHLITKTVKTVMAENKSEKKAKE